MSDKAIGVPEIMRRGGHVSREGGRGAEGVAVVLILDAPESGVSSPRPIRRRACLSIALASFTLSLLALWYLVTG